MWFQPSTLADVSRELFPDVTAWQIHLPPEANLCVANASEHPGTDLWICKNWDSETTSASYQVPPQPFTQLSLRENKTKISHTSTEKGGYKERFSLLQLQWKCQILSSSPPTAQLPNKNNWEAAETLAWKFRGVQPNLLHKQISKYPVRINCWDWCFVYVIHLQSSFCKRSESKVPALLFLNSSFTTGRSVPVSQAAERWVACPKNSLQLVKKNFFPPVFIPPICEQIEEKEIK